MPSLTWLLASQLTTTLLFLGCLLLQSRTSRRSQQELAQKLTTMQAATLKVSYSSTEALIEAILKMSEDSRSQIVAMSNSARQMATEHLQATSLLSERLQQAAREQSFRQAAEMARYERLISGPQESLTSMLTTTIRLLGTKDALAYRSVATADVPPDAGGEPYTTGDEIATDRMQSDVDRMFETWQGEGVTDGAAADGSAFAEFGIPGV